MASSKLLRNEIRTATNGRMFSTWAFVTPGWHPTITEFLVHGCDLKMRHLEDAPEKHMHDASHEVALYALDPRTPLDFTRSLFNQPQLNVLGDARISYQVGHGRRQRLPPARRQVPRPDDDARAAALLRGPA